MAGPYFLININKHNLKIPRQEVLQMDLKLSDIRSFESICRTCMKTGTLISIFLPNKKYAIKFSEMLHYCAEVEVNENDNLPAHICKQCKTNLVALYKFKFTVKNSDATLRQLLIDNNKKSELKFEDFENSNDFVTTTASDDDLKVTLNDTTVSDKNSINNEDLKPLDDIKNQSLVLHEIPVVDIKVNKYESYDNDVSTPNHTSSTNKKLNKRQLKDKQIEKSYQCDVCGKILSCRSNLIQHMRKHTGEKPFACDLCEKRFARAEHVTIHRRIHTGERPHSCTICQKSFVQYAALTAHLRTHSGERPHMCAICGKSFSQSVSLTYHTRTHTGETPFKCKICNKGFAHSGNLNIHMRFHRNERPFVCNVCGRRFVTSSHLTVHIKQHTGDRPHRCNLCGKAFARSEHLKDHLVIHTGQKPHACKLCPKRYTQSSHLNRHMKTHKS